MEHVYEWGFSALAWVVDAFPIYTLGIACVGLVYAGALWRRGRG